MSNMSWVKGDPSLHKCLCGKHPFFWEHEGSTPPPYREPTHALVIRCHCGLESKEFPYHKYEDENPDRERAGKELVKWWNDLFKESDELTRQRDATFVALQKENAERGKLLTKIESLKKYARHLEGCPHISEWDPPCTCGLSELGESTAQTPAPGPKDDK